MQPAHENTVRLIAISYAKGLLKKESQEQCRAKQYAERLLSYDVIVFTRAKEGLVREATSGNLRVHATHSRNRLFMLIDAYRIGRRLVKQRKEKAVIVTAQDPFETSCVALMLARARHVHYHLQIHGDFFGSTRWRGESILNWIRYAFGTFALKRATCIRVVSERIKRSLLARGVPETAITVLPIYSDLEPYLNIDKREVDADESITILAAGRLAPEKNISLILRAFEQLIERFPQAQLRIVGSGPEEAALKRMTHELGVEAQVTFVPWVPTLTREMQQADIFALASDHEGYALVLVEALAAGIPVVTTDVGCAGEVVLHEKHGLIVPVGDVDAFANALRSLATDTGKRIRMGKAGRETARGIAAMGGDAYTDAWVASFSQCLQRV